jgi:CPA1 family monovalent cation:H+ antiporter
VLLFITFGVILITLVGQGLTLRLLTRLLRIGGDGAADREETHARSLAAEAAVARIDELAREWPDHRPLIETLRSQYEHRATHLAEASPGGDGLGGPLDPAAEQELLEHRLIRRAVIDAERETLLSLRDRGAITDEVWRRLQRDLDLEELRMEA